jgi:hypothetical protein
VGKPPVSDAQLEQRVASLEMRADATDDMLAGHEQAIADLNARVAVLEQAASTTPPIEIGLPGGIIDNTLPTPEPPKPEPIGEGLVVVIRTSSGETDYEQAGAEDMGDYVEPADAFMPGDAIWQHCYRAPRQDVVLPGLTVWFRPDADGLRQEVIVELGVPLTSTLTPVNMGAYTAEIWDADELVAEIAVPSHPWYARWRWQSAPRPVRVDRQTLIQSGLVPHYDGAILGQFIADLAPQTYTVMGFSGMVTGMGWTGDRPDIGIMTGWQAQYLCKGNNASTVIAQGEASGTISMHLRDPETGAPLDLANDWPTLTSYPSGGDPIVPLTKGIVIYDSGHSPACSYLPWLLTGDPYYLEALQFQANIEIIGEPASGRYTWAGRYGAWPLRNKLYAAVASPVDPPRWLLPKSVFHEHMEGVRAEALKDMADPNPILDVFRARQFGGSQGTPAHPSGTYAVFWQCAFESLVYGMCVQLGYDEWSEVLTWKIDSEVQRTNGEAWPRSAPCPYNTGLVYTCSLTAAITEADRFIPVDKYGGGPWPVEPFEVKCQSETMTVIDKSDGGACRWSGAGRADLSVLARGGDASRGDAPGRRAAYAGRSKRDERAIQRNVRLGGLRTVCACGACCGGAQRGERGCLSLCLDRCRVHSAQPQLMAPGMGLVHHLANGSS